MADWIVKELQEKGVSGFKVSADDRDAILELREDALQKRFDILLLFMFDRLGRRSNETPFVVEWFIKQGIRVVSVKEGEQLLDNHTDDLINYIRYWQGEGESKNTSIRIQARMRQLHRAGLYTGGPVVFGYCLVDKGRKNKNGQSVQDLAIEPGEAAIVQEIFKRTIADGVGAYVFANELNARGIRTHYGAGFQGEAIHAILRNRAYLGYFIKRGIPSQHIPELQIVDDSTFEQASAVLQQRRETAAAYRALPRKSATSLLLCGILYCGTCGHRLASSNPSQNAQRKKPQYICPACRSNRSASRGQCAYTRDKIDRIVLAKTQQLLAFSSLLTSDDIQYKLDNRIKKAKEQLHQEREKLVKVELEESDALNEILPVLLHKSTSTADEVTAFIAQKEKQCHRIAAWVERQENAYNSLRDLRRTSSILCNNLALWSEEFSTADSATQQQILTLLYEHVEVNRGNAVSIRLAPDYHKLLSYAGNRKIKEFLQTI